MSTQSSLKKEHTIDSTPDSLTADLTELMSVSSSEDSNSSRSFGDLLPPNQFSFHRIYIFDLDDTIFPTSILSKCVNVWDHTDQCTIRTLQPCHTLYHTVKRCIDYMLDLQQSLYLKYGQPNVSMVIVTNASCEWFTEIKQEHSVLIGELFAKLQAAMPLISAKDAFQQKYDDWYSEYSISAKVDAFTHFISSIELHGKIPVVYSVGDGSCEYYGIKEACQNLWGGGDDDDDEDEDDDEEEDDSQSEKQTVSVTPQKHGNDDEDADSLYILHRLKLETNRKKTNRDFDALGGFEKVLRNTQKFLFHDDKQLVDVLQREDEEKSSVQDEEEEDEEEEDEEEEWNIIDYIL